MKKAPVQLRTGVELLFIENVGGEEISPSADSHEPHPCIVFGRYCRKFAQKAYKKSYQSYRP